MVRLTIVPDTCASHRHNYVSLGQCPDQYIRAALVIEGTAADNAQVTNVMYWFTNFNAGLNPSRYNVMFTAMPL